MHVLYTFSNADDVNGNHSPRKPKGAVPNLTNNFPKLFSFSKNNVYTNISLKHAQELQDDFENDKKFMALLTSLYKEHTTMTDKKIKSVLLHDIWWSSQECMDNGLVDALWDSSTTSIGVQNLVSGAVFESRKNRVEMEIEEEAVTKRRKVRK